MAIDALDPDYRRRLYRALLPVLCLPIAAALNRFLGEPWALIVGLTTGIWCIASCVAFLVWRRRRVHRL